MNHILIRYGEFALKSPKVRSKFEKQLENNIKFALNEEKISYNVLRLPLQGRIFIETEEIEKAMKVLSNTFGIVSLSPVLKSSSDLSDILSESLKVANTSIKRKNSFAINVRRSGKHEYSSKDVAIQVGDLINEKLKDRNIKVDLSNPDVTIYIEIRDEWAYIFKEIIEGPGGFPYNTQEKLISFLLGDTYSYISNWLMLRKGCLVIPTIFNFSAFYKKNVINQLEKIAKSLKSYISSNKFYVYLIPDCRDFIQSNKSLETLDELQVNLQLMYVIANYLANFKKARGLVGYDTFSEMNNLKNLKDFEKILKYPIFRPLLGLKEDDLNQLMSKFDKTLFINRNQISIFNQNLEFQIFNKFQIEIINEIAKTALKKAEKLKI